MDGMGELRQLVRVAADQAGGYRALSRRARGEISVSTLNNIATGKASGAMKTDKIAALAVAIGKTPREVSLLLGRPYADPAQPFVLPDRAHALSRAQRKVVLSVVDAILTAATAAEVEAPRALRSVASGRRGPSADAREEASAAAVKARQEQGGE